MNNLAFLLLLSIIALAPDAHSELKPENVAVIANSNDPDSTWIAQYYLAAREIPEKNLITLALPQGETIARQDYDKLLVKGIRDKLRSRKITAEIKVLALAYGVPLRVAAPISNELEKNTLLDAVAKKKLARRGLEKILLQTYSIPASQPATPPAKSEISELPLKTLVKQIDTGLREAQSRVRIIRDPSQIQAESVKLKNIVASLGGFNALTQTLKPKPGSELSKGAQELQQLKTEIEAAKRMLLALQQTPSPQNRKRSYAITQRVFGLIGVLQKANAELKVKTQDKADASVESELSLLWLDRSNYPTNGRVPNPLFYQHAAKRSGQALTVPILMVSRIDAPKADQAIAMIDSAITAENKGLIGEVYIDSQGLPYKLSDIKSVWDKDIQDLAWSLRRSTSFTVNHDKSPQLFDSAKNTALYVGWYQLRKYEDVFTFAPGAIAYHIASEEAVSIRDPKETGWCANMLKRGVTATLGAIGEPYLDSFPPPREFLALILSGRYSYVEAYYLTTKYLSWRMALFGDPLYNPFKGRGDFPIAESNLKAFGKDLERYPTAPSDEVFSDPSELFDQIKLQTDQRKKQINQFFQNLQNSP